MSCETASVSSLTLLPPLNKVSSVPSCGFSALGSSLLLEPGTHCHSVPEPREQARTAARPKNRSTNHDGDLTTPLIAKAVQSSAYGRIRETQPRYCTALRFAAHLADKKLVVEIRHRGKTLIHYALRWSQRRRSEAEVSKFHDT